MIQFLKRQQGNLGMKLHLKHYYLVQQGKCIKRKRYNEELIKLKEQYVEKREYANIKLKNFINEIKATKPSIK